MKSTLSTFFIICLILIILADATTQEITGIREKDVKNFKTGEKQLVLDDGLLVNAYLCKATGNLKISKKSSTETYEAYFHIPVPYREQVPILVEVESPHLIDFRFIHLNPPNVIIAAQMRQADSTSLNWTAWIFITENRYSDIPGSVPLPSLEQLPDSVKKWLEPTDCVQINDPFVKQTAETVRGSISDLNTLANAICNYCDGIPWQFPHTPIAFDAVYALTWGSSCTGHAHAGAALFRANGIPARTLLTMPTWASNFDMHWVIDYFVPDYGWVRMETSTGQHPSPPHNEIVTLACNPEDEFPLFFPSGIEGYWHTSDPALGMYSPQWGRAHTGYYILSVSNSQAKIDQAFALTDSVFHYYSNYWGINLSANQQTIFQNAFNYQATALSNLVAKSDIHGYVNNLQLALNQYKNIDAAPITTVFFDDFEGGSSGWTHGGQEDEWELGFPIFGPTKSFSGGNCWGTDLDNSYENNADCWLQSPLIDLSNYACAYLSFWLWNWVEDKNQGLVYDPLWLDVSTNDTTYYPLCSHIGGVNDDPVIPDVGGWTMIALDLTKYIGNTVQIRFRFESDPDDVQPGSYIDDFRVYGRKSGVSAIQAEKKNTYPQAFGLSQNYPNPFNSVTHIDYTLPVQGEAHLVVYNTLGERICTLVEENKPAGKYMIRWNGFDKHGNPIASGMYFYRLQVATEGNIVFNQTKKLVLLK